MIKLRPSSVHTIPSILAAERVRALPDANSIESVVVETYKYAKDGVGTGAQRWHPQSREAADHSIPYVVAATLVHGTLTLRSFDESMLQNPEMRSLIQKIEVIENPDYTTAHARTPAEYRTAVKVATRDGTRLTGEWSSGSSAAGTDYGAIERKFLGFAEPLIGAARAQEACDVLWTLDRLPDVSVVPPLFAVPEQGD